MDAQQLSSLLTRLEETAIALDGLAIGQWGGPQGEELARIRGKAEGVRLALRQVKEASGM